MNLYDYGELIAAGVIAVVAYFAIAYLSEAAFTVLGWR